MKEVQRILVLFKKKIKILMFRVKLLCFSLSLLSLVLPVTGRHWKEPGPILCAPLIQVFI